MKNLLLASGMGAALLTGACATTTPIEKPGVSYEKEAEDATREVATTLGYSRLEALAAQEGSRMSNSEFNEWLTDYDVTMAAQEFKQALDVTLALADVHYNISPGGCGPQGMYPRSLVDKEMDTGKRYQVAAQWLLGPVESGEATSTGRAHEMRGYMRTAEQCLANGDGVRMAATANAIDNRNRHVLLGAAMGTGIGWYIRGPGGNGGSIFGNGTNNNYTGPAFK